MLLRQRKLPHQSKSQAGWAILPINLTRQPEIPDFQNTMSQHGIWSLFCCGSLILLSVTGCGTILSRTATDQLLVSYAVDESIDQLDFRPLSGKTCFLDTRYLRNIRGIGFVNADYITSSLRERMVAANCLIQDSANNAEYIVEARVGALGTDGHEVNYGIPSSQPISAASSIISGVAAMPTFPEVSLAKKEERRGAAKISVFAYHRESRKPIWQPHVVQGKSVAKATWLLGAGPFQRGTIYDSTQFAGEPIDVPTIPTDSIPSTAIANWVAEPWKPILSRSTHEAKSTHDPLRTCPVLHEEEMSAESEEAAVVLVPRSPERNSKTPASN